MRVDDIINHYLEESDLQLLAEARAGEPWYQRADRDPMEKYHVTISEDVLVRFRNALSMLAYELRLVQNKSETNPEIVPDPPQSLA